MDGAGTARAKLRGVLLVVGVIVGIGVLGRGLSGGGAEAVVLDVPTAGQAAPAQLPDGTPVFVSHEVNGDVHVVEAINPHRYWGLTTVVGWCPKAAAFEDALDGSRFDAAGRWLFGPAPHGLATYEVTRNDTVLLVGQRQKPAPRSRIGDPAVRQWCGATEGGDVLAHVPDGRAELLAVPGHAVQWCDGIQATDPPRCATTLGTLPGPVVEGDRSWSWEGPVLGDPAAPATLRLLAGGNEEQPARGTLARVFAQVRRLSTVGGLRLVVDHKVVFGDFFHRARPLEFGEPVPSLWKLGDADGRVIYIYDLPGYTEHEARALIGELVDMVVASNRRIDGLQVLTRS